MFGKLPNFPRWLQELLKVYHLTLILEENKCTHTLACIVIYLVMCFLAFVFPCICVSLICASVSSCTLCYCIYLIACICLHTHTLFAFIWLPCVSLLSVCLRLFITLMHFHIAYFLCVTCLVIYLDSIWRDLECTHSLVIHLLDLNSLCAFLAWFLLSMHSSHLHIIASC